MPMSERLSSEPYVKLLGRALDLFLVQLPLHELLQHSVHDVGC